MPDVWMGEVGAGCRRSAWTTVGLLALSLLLQ